MSLAKDREVLAPGTWRARFGQAAALAAEVASADGSSVQEVMDALRAAIAALPPAGLNAGEVAARIDERIDAGWLKEALEFLAPGSVSGAWLHGAPVSYGSALPAAAGRAAGELFVVEGPPPLLYWLKPGAAAAVTNRNRVQVAAQAGAGAAFAAWEHGFSAASAPENDGDFLGSLARLPAAAANQYRYSIYLRQDALADLGIDVARDDGVKFYATVGGEVRAFKRWAAGDEVIYRGQRYAEFATDAIANLAAFTDGTTYDVLFWSDSGGSAPIDYKPATRRAAGSWELLSRLGHVGRLIAKLALPAAPGAAGTKISTIWTVESAFSSDWTTPQAGHQRGDLNFKGCAPQPGIVIRTKVGADVTSCYSIPYLPAAAPSNDSQEDQTIRRYFLATAKPREGRRNVTMEYWNRFRNQPWVRLRLFSGGDALSANTTIEVLEWVA